MLCGQTYQMVFLNSASFSSSSGSKINSGFGPTMTPGLNRPRPNITADLMWGSPFRIPSGDMSVPNKKIGKCGSATQRHWIRLGLGRVRKASVHQRNRTVERTNLFSRAMHKLVIYTAEHFPVIRKGRVGDNEVTRRVPHGISYLDVVNAKLASWRGLCVCKSTTCSSVGAWGSTSYLNHHLVGTITIGNEVGLD